MGEFMNQGENTRGCRILRIDKNKGSVLISQGKAAKFLYG